MAKKSLLLLPLVLVVAFFLSYIIKNTKLSFDKDAKYKANIPNAMRVAHVKKTNSNTFYKDIYVDRKHVPSIGKNDVLVYVKSATLTQRDYDFFIHNQDKEEFVPCSDFSGIVVKVGEDVKDFEIGEKVFGIADLNDNGGACAEYVSVASNNIYKMPYSLSFKQASAIPTPALLNWFALHNLQKQGLSKGMVLVDDAISEVGVMLTSMLSREGYEISAVDDEDAKKIVNKTEIKHFISNTEFLNEKEKFLDKYDVVINLRHGLPINELIKLVKPKGTFISYEKTDVNREDIKTFIIDNKKIETKIFADIAQLVHRGKIQVKIAEEFNLENIRKAYEMALNGSVNGKVVVNVN